jgi:hypothetical protein
MTPMEPTANCSFQFAEIRGSHREKHTAKGPSFRVGNSRRPRNAPPLKEVIRGRGTEQEGPAPSRLPWMCGKGQRS